MNQQYPNYYFLSFIKLVEKMRDAQRNYFYHKKRHDEQNAQKFLRQSFALEKRVDNACTKCRELIQTHYQPELYK